MKTVHPVQSVLPSEPRPPARTGIDNSAPMIDVAVTKVTEWRVEVPEMIEQVATGRLTTMATAPKQTILDDELQSARMHATSEVWA